MRLNSPRPQLGPLAWAAVCLVGIWVGVDKMRQFPVASDGWWAGVILILLVLFGFAVLEAWWFGTQREVEVAADRVVIRRWTDILVGRQGTMIPRVSLAQIGLIFDGGKKVEFVSTSGQRTAFWVGLWEPTSLRELLRGLQEAGIAVRKSWEP